MEEMSKKRAFVCAKGVQIVVLEAVVGLSATMLGGKECSPWTNLYNAYTG